MMHQMDKELGGKMWEDKIMTKAFTNYLTQIILCDEHSLLLKSLPLLEKCMFFINCKWSCPLCNKVVL